MSTLTCRRCGSSKIIPHVQFIDQGEYSDGYLRVGLATKPQALLMKGWVRVKVWADICGDCGQMELSIDDPHTLYAAYQEVTRT